MARALAWHARGHRFDPDILHYRNEMLQRSLTYWTTQGFLEAVRPKEKRANLLSNKGKNQEQHSILERLESLESLEKLESLENL